MAEPHIDDLLMGAAIQLDALVLARKRQRESGIQPQNPLHLMEDLDRIMRQLWVARNHVAPAAGLGPPASHPPHPAPTDLDPQSDGSVVRIDFRRRRSGCGEANI